MYWFNNGKSLSKGKQDMKSTAFGPGKLMQDFTVSWERFHTVPWIAILVSPAFTNTDLNRRPPSTIFCLGLPVVIFTLKLRK